MTVEVTFGYAVDWSTAPSGPHGDSGFTPDNAITVSHFRIGLGINDSLSPQGSSFLLSSLKFFSEPTPRLKLKLNPPIKLLVE